MFASRLAATLERIAEAARRAGRNPDDVQLLAVTKTHDRTVVDEARAAGVTLFGENRVQEAAAKYGDIAGEVELHLIGHLQRNKAKLVPGLFTCVESIDSRAVAEALSRRFQSAGLTCDVLMELNSSGEASKYGYLEDEQLLDDAAAVAALPGIRLRGVMTIGPFVDDQARVAKAFERTRLLFERLQSALPRERITTLSMGMSDDFEIAVALGSTEVRIGSALFGARE